MKSQTNPPPLLDWAVASRPLEGELESGDCHLVRSFPHGVLVAVVDGLGHGPEAAQAARTAVAILEGYAHESIPELVQRCHDKLRRTRGVVMSLASFEARNQAMTWLGVGNVEGVLLRADPNARPTRETVLLRGGVVGYQLPPLRPGDLTVDTGDLLILATDGIRNVFADGVVFSDSPQQIAERILRQYATGKDDALVLVARCRGGQP